MQTSDSKSLVVNVSSASGRSKDIGELKLVQMK
jgi:hypothetical protein